LWRAFTFTFALLGACQPDQGRPARIVERVHAAGKFVSLVALDASGRALLGLSGRDELSVWSLPNSEPDLVFSIPSQGPLILADFVASERVMTVTATGLFNEWNWATRAIAYSHKLYAGGVAAYSSDGRYLAIGGEVWDRKEQRDLATLRFGEQTALEFSANGSRLLSASRHPSELIVREPSSSRIFRQKVDKDIRAVAINPRGDRVAAALLGGIVRVFRVPGFQIVSEFWSTPDPVALQFLDEEHVVTAGESCVEVHEVATSWKTFRGAIKGQITAFASSGGQAVAGSSEGRVWIWDLAKAETLASAQVASSEIWAIALDSKTRSAAAGDGSGVITMVGW